MKQYNVVCRFTAKNNINVKRNAMWEDLQDISVLTDPINPPLRPYIYSCMDLMKATVLKAGLIKLGIENIEIEELSEKHYRDLETLNSATALQLISNPTPIIVKPTFN